MTVVLDRAPAPQWRRPDPRLLLEPDGVRRYLSGFPADALRTAEGRRRLTRVNPLLFALVYTPDLLRKQLPDGSHTPITFSEFHIEVAEAAKRWAKPNIRHKEIRESYVAPRESGKSTWALGILPLWAIAHQHRRYVFAFSSNQRRAEAWLANVKRHLQNPNSLIARDFPDLCAPLRRPGGQTDSDRQSVFMARSGITFEARGIESTVLGANQSGDRPDLIIFDDIEPSESDYSLGEKEKRLAKIREGILPMGWGAVVTFIGTVTMEGSIVHDIVRSTLEGEETAPEWVQAEGITARRFPAILTDDTGAERSLWPAKWSLSELQEIRDLDPRGFALNYEGVPGVIDPVYWKPGMMVREEITTSHRLISVDPAVTTNRPSGSKKGSDYTGIAVIGWNAAERRCLLMHAEQVRLTGPELATHVKALGDRFTTRAVLVESNQAGDLWRDSVFGPAGLTVQTEHVTGPKELRWMESLHFWTRRWVVHDPTSPTVGAFERQAMAVPNAGHDDITDAVVAGVRYWMRNRLIPGQPKNRVTSYI